MKNLRNVLFVGAALAIFAGFAWATDYAPPDAPDWWKLPGADPDGVTRTQFHSFITDPDLGQNPDYTYNGWNLIPGQADDWGFEWNPVAFGQIIGSTGPYPPADNGLGLLVPGFGGAAPEVMSKMMVNRENLELSKLFFVVLTWYDPTNGNATLTIDVDGDLVSGGDATVTPHIKTVPGPGGWRTTTFWGTIFPQPDHEHFDFHFLGNSEPLYVDSAWVGTHCVPEPSTIAMMLFGGLGVVGGVIRKFRR